MSKLAADVLGQDCELLNGDEGLLDKRQGLGVTERIAAADEVVLLWPDAIGYGWRAIERRVFALRRAGGGVFALTGRRRHFELTPALLALFRARRLLERLWLGEALLAAGLLLSAPVLIAWDFARGKR
jgi:hypothetical protein